MVFSSDSCQRDLRPRAHRSGSGATGQEHPPAFSPTALRAYDTCPRSYEFAYLLRPEVDEPPSPHLIFGNALHQALAFLFRLAIPDRNLVVAEQALRHHWALQEGRDQAFLSREEEAAWGQDALQALARLCSDRSDELETEPLAVEEWVRAPLADGRALGGKVDRVDEVSTLIAGETVHGLRITDYKTGRCKIEDGAELAEDRGAQVYALAATRTFRRPVLEVRFLFLRENRAVTWEPEREDLLALEDKLATQVERIVADEEFEPRPDFACRWCDYRRLCPDGAGRASVDDLDLDPEVVF